MKRRKKTKPEEIQKPVHASQKAKSVFHIEFLNPIQKKCWEAIEKNDIVFLLGSAGSGKTFLSTAYAVYSFLKKETQKITITRPIVEAGEKLGYLPGSFEEKVHPYMLPIYDTLDELVGTEGPQRMVLNKSLEVAPIAYLRGRAETLDSPIVTPTGIVPMGEIKFGDKVIGSDGKPILVTGVFPQGKKKIYKVTFNDKTFVKCSGDHLWSTMTLNEKRYNKGYTVKSTLEIAETLKLSKGRVKNHRVPLLSAPVQFEQRETLIDPYLMGLLLGDGYLGKANISLTSSDVELINEAEKRLPSGIVFKKSNSRKYDYITFSKNKRSELRKHLNNYGLIGKKSKDKYVPENYKINSVETRLEILRGLMDTDGSVFIEKRSGKCRVQFYSTSKQLADDVMFLVRSLGGYAYYRKREFDESDNHEYDGHTIKHVHSSYVVDIRLDFNPFRLSRKAEKFKNQQNYVKLISNVEFIGEEECQCISVDSTDRLYVTNGFNITHNTFKYSVCILDEAQNCTYTQLKLFLTRLGQNSKLIITGDPKQSDLPGRIALLEIVDKLKDVKGIGIVDLPDSSIVRHPLIASIVERI